MTVGDDLRCKQEKDLNANRVSNEKIHLTEPGFCFLHHLNHTIPSLCEGVAGQLIRLSLYW